MANRIGHPAIVAVLDDDRTSAGVPFLVMELLDGESLHDRIQSGPLPALDVLAVADGVLDVLEAAHAVGVLHRDLKPENLFLTERRELKVLDFGIARCREVSGEFTVVGQTMGTPVYMSPEQARGAWDLVDERSDLFSLAATLFVLATGALPRREVTFALELVAAMSEPIRSVRDVRPDVPPELAEIIDRGLQMRPEDRYSSAADMRDAVRRAWWGLTSSPPSDPTVPVPTQPDATPTVPRAPAAIAREAREAVAEHVGRLVAESGTFPEELSASDYSLLESGEVPRASSRPLERVRPVSGRRSRVELGAPPEPAPAPAAPAPAVPLARDTVPMATLLPVEASPPQPPAEAPHPRRRRLAGPLLLSGAILVVLALTAAILATWHLR